MAIKDVSTGVGGLLSMLSCDGDRSRFIGRIHALEIEQGGPALLYTSLVIFADGKSNSQKHVSRNMKKDISLDPSHGRWVANCPRVCAIFTKERSSKKECLPLFAEEIWDESNGVYPPAGEPDDAESVPLPNL